MDLTLVPLPHGFGARIDHDLAVVTDPQVADALGPALTAALHRYRLLVMPGQHLNHADLIAVGGLFGGVDTDVDTRYGVPGFPGLTVVSNIIEGGSPIGIYDGDDEEEWHADNSFKAQLTRATMLYSVITPAAGGQTRFADATRAYADLPAARKRQVDHLSAVHSIQELGARQAETFGGRSSSALGTLIARAEVQHPLAPVHPVTGARSLLVGTMVVKTVLGLPSGEGDQLLADLLAHATDPAYVHTHQWSQGDLVVWDNQALLHTASPCDSTRHRRLLYRMAIR